MTERKQELSSLVLAGYDEFVQDLKNRVKQAQVKAALSVNQELINLYWQIGRDILDRQEAQGWGSKVIDKLSADLRVSFPDMTGFSVRNLKYMRAIAEAYPDFEFVQQAVAQIPWGHNVRILDQVKDADQRRWYIEQTIEHGWSRDVLVHQIESGLYERQGKALTNFKATLPEPQSDLAQQLLKDPYNFEFLTLDKDAKEKELEAGLLEQLRKTLLELGAGFAFVGSQRNLVVGGQDFYIDLLFFHYKLNCFIVVELKVTEFIPEYAGKMAFYLAAVDDLLREEHHNPTIGLLLCKNKNEIVAEYALRNNQSPIGISGYRVNQALPPALEEALPALATIEKELETRLIKGESILPSIQSHGKITVEEANRVEKEK